MQALAYDFQAGSLLYSIISTDPPRVSVAGHVDGENAQGELDIPFVVTYEDMTYTVTEIGEWAFKNCTGLTGQLYFPSTIDTIREGAFYGCSGFTGSLDLSFSTVVFKENVFRNCTGFTELYLPLFISEIPLRLFSGCSGLTGTLALPETVEIIGVGAFAQCSGFTGLVLPNGLREIRENAFSECSGFTGNLVFPETVTHIKIGAFHNCTGFSGNLVIPQAIIELGTENTSGSFNGSFEGCTGFTGLVLGESLEKIGCVCFRDCTGFTGPLVLPEGLKEIWTCAFQGCSGFTGALAFPSSLTFIGSNAFEACIGFSGTLVIPETIENVQSYAFAACTGIENVILPQQYVFQNTDVTTMGVFEGCTGLTSIDIPEGWEYTVPWMFEDCSNLVSVHLPESLRRISAYCFSYCTSLSEINVPEGLKEIGRAAFLGCTSLAEFDFRNLTNIMENAFSHCVNLTSPSGDLIIPDSLESIKFRSFDSCVGFHRLVIGTRVNHIEESAFNHTEFESIVMRTEVPPTLSRINILSNWHFPNDIPITVPCGTLEAYLNDEVWSEFTNISEGMVYNFVALSGDEDMGSVNVLKEASCDDMTVEVEAVPRGNGVFLHWEANGEIVSSENPYNFTLDEDTRLVAVFSGAGIEETGRVVSLFPNPANDIVCIEGEKATEVRVYNTLGQLVKTVQNNNEVSLEGLPQGVYLLRVTLEGGKVFSDKVVKE